MELSLIGAQYRERLRRRGRQPESIRNFERAWFTFERYCNTIGVELTQMDSVQMEEFFAVLAHAPTTKRLYLAQIRAAYRYALARGLVQMDPTVDVELAPMPDKRIRTITNARLREMKGSCYNERQWLMFHLFAYTGCRKNEIRELHWDAVDLEGQTLFIMGKGGKMRYVPIHPALATVLIASKRKGSQAVLGNAYGRPFHYTYVDDIMKSFAGNESTFHDFRRTVASSLDANGVEEGLIMKIMGWAPKTIFDRHYRNVVPERLHQAILKLYADDPI